MTDKELRRLSRLQLLEMLVAQGEENQRLKGELAAAQAALADRKLVLDQAGSIAEAALRLENVRRLAQAPEEQDP